MEKSYVLRKHCKRLCAVVLTGFIFGLSTQVSLADSWTANSPDQIEISEGQTSYTLRRGDTLWLISQKINTTVENLAEINGIDLSVGEEKRLSVGRKITLPGASSEAFTNIQNPVDEISVESPVNTNLSTLSEKVNAVNVASSLSLEGLMNRVESVEVIEDATHIKLKNGESMDNFVKDLEKAVKETSKPVVAVTPIEIVEENPKEVNSGEVSDGKDSDRQRVKKLKESIILYSYMPDGDWTKANGVNFYVSDIKSPDKLVMISQIGSEVIDGRDPSIFVSKDKEIFVAVTKYSKEMGSEVRIYKTTDLLNFESFDVDLGINKLTANSSYYWAPDFFQDLDGKVYLTISAGPNLKEFSQFVSEINLQSMSVNNTRKLSLPDDNYIDGNIINDGSQYILSIKNEREKKLELFVSENFIDWKQKEDDIVSTAFGEEVLYSEGQYILEHNGVYSIYFDKYSTSNGIEKSQYVTTTTDWESYSRPTKVSAEDNSVLRHGSAVVIDSDDEKLSNEVLEVIGSKTNYVEEIISDGMSVDTNLEEVSVEEHIEESIQLDTLSCPENVEVEQAEEEELNIGQVSSETLLLNEQSVLVDNLSQENANNENNLDIKDGNN